MAIKFNTLKYFPAKSCTPIIAKISQKIKHTNNTLKMDGIACTSAFTTTYYKEIPPDYYVKKFDLHSFFSIARLRYEMIGVRVD